jgi:hypothetical protein
MPPSTDGQIDPLRLGEKIVEKDAYDNEVSGVRVYRGRPDSLKEPRGYGAPRPGAISETTDACGRRLGARGTGRLAALAERVADARSSYLGAPCFAAPFMGG